MTGLGKPRGEHGFTLVEMLIATTILTFAAMGMAALVSQAVRLQSQARDGRIATALARNQIEQLRLSRRYAPQRRVGGSLESDQADHFDWPQVGFVRRWRITEGPAGTQDVTVQVAPSGGAVFAPVRLRTLLQ